MSRGLELKNWLRKRPGVRMGIKLFLLFCLLASIFFSIDGKTKLFYAFMHSVFGYEDKNSLALVLNERRIVPVVMRPQRAQLD